MKQRSFFVLLAFILSGNTVMSANPELCDLQASDETHIVAQTPAHKIIFAARDDKISVNSPVGFEILLCNMPDDATLNKVDAIMPIHQHGMNYTPQISKLSANKFLAEPFIFHMPGNWQLQAIVIKNDDVFEFKKDFLLTP